MIHSQINAVDPSLLRSLWAAWPERSWRGWHKYASETSSKYATRDASMLPRAAWPVLYEMATECSHMLCDPFAFPDWELHGAGLHMMEPGGHLGRHLDASVMPGTEWKREASCILFVNPDWPSNGGGKLILNDEEVLPEFNKLVMFRSTDDAWHEVTQVKHDQPRCTLSLFFWSNRPVETVRNSAQFESMT